MKNLIMLLLSCFGAAQVIAQNPYWAFPPKYVDFNVGGTVKNLGTGAINKSVSANAIFSQTGTLQLFSTNNGTGLRYYDRLHNLMAVSPSLPAFGDFTFVPVPGMCNTYLVPSFDLDGQLSFDKYRMAFSKVRFNGTTGSCIEPGDLQDISNSRFNSTQIGMAVPTTPDISSSVALPYLYLIGARKGSSDMGNRIDVDMKYVQSGNMLNKSFTMYLSQAAGIEMSVWEAELSHDGNKLAVIWKHVQTNSNSSAAPASDKIYLINNIKSCVTGNCGLSSVTTITVPNATNINGIEFSPDGTKLFYTKTPPITPPHIPAINGIGFFDLNTNVHTEIAGTLNMGNSYIEYALDGFMYISDGLNLKGYNVVNPAVRKDIMNVPNVLYNGVYTLPDQIDGADYTYVASDCKNGSVNYTTNQLPSVTKVNGSVTASGTASILSGGNVTFTSNSSVILQPNFSALNGSNFKANIAPCNVICNNGCSSSSFRLEEADEPTNSVIENSNALFVHPNPITSGNLNFGRAVSNYTLMNSTGAVMQQGVNADKLDVTGLSKGMYMLKLDDKIEKVVIE